jgi:hypothetical protein
MASRGRAVIDPSDRGAFSFKAIAHPSCQVGIGVFVEVATADAGLVSDNNDRPLQLIGPETSQVKNSGNELELVRPMNIATVHIDDAITVEKKRAIMHEPRRVSVAGGSRQPAVELRNSVIASSFATLPFRASLTISRDSQRRSGNVSCHGRRRAQRYWRGPRFWDGAAGNAAALLA